MFHTLEFWLCSVPMPYTEHTVTCNLHVSGIQFRTFPIEKLQVPVHEYSTTESW